MTADEWETRAAARKRRVLSAVGMVAAISATWALSACGGGDQPDSESAQAVPLTTITSPLSTAGTKPSGSRGAEQTTKAVDDDKKPSSSSSSSAANKAPSCPTGMSKRECTELAKHSHGAAGKAQGPKDCLRTHTRAECKQIAEAQKNTGPGRPLTPANCVQILGREQCEALAQQQH